MRGETARTNRFSVCFAATNYYGDAFRQVAENNADKKGIRSDADLFNYCNWNSPIINLKRKKVQYGVYAFNGRWGDSVRQIYREMQGDAAGYEDYFRNIDKSVVIQIADELEIVLPEVSFFPNQDAQTSKGKLNGEWTINGESK